MPPEPSKGSGRRLHRKDALDGHQVREIELKRSRGEISCAECRRLKIKCDKQVPCQSCRRRGCESLCPNDSLTTGQGTRSVLAATEHLHDQITSLTKRVRDLEDALATSHAQASTEPHPLLQQNGDSTSSVETLAMNIDVGSKTPVAEQQLSEFFGTLTVSENGVPRFFGPSGGAESLLRGDDSPVQSGSSTEASDGEATPDSSVVPEVVVRFARFFPFHLDGPVGAIQKMIEAQLPSYERALGLCEAFGDRITWIYRAVAKSQLIDDLLPTVYGKYGDNPSEDCTGPHALALLFTVIAIGTVMEASSSAPNRVEAERYFQLARGSLCLRSILDKPSIATVQTFELLSVYMSMRGDDVVDRESRMESTWSFVTLAAHLSHTLGLHRDGARWGLPPKMVERRRRLFWDIFVFDVWQSLITGRPMACHISSVDCKFPEAEDPAITEAERWQFQFCATCVAEVAAQAVIPATPTYSKIQELGQKVESFPAPPSYESPDPASEPVQENMKLTLLCLLISHSREIILLYIHRSYFIQAILDHPDNPLLSEYNRSFLVTYRAARTILTATRDMFGRYPDIVAPVWYLWSFAFSAAVVFGAVVIKGPHSALAQAAMEELEQAYVLLTKAAPINRRAAEALPILVRLRKKAREAYNTVDKEGPEAISGPSQDDTEDELSIFAGRASRVVSRRRSRSLRGLEKARSSACTTPATSGSYASSAHLTPDRPGNSPAGPSEDMAGHDWAYNYYDAYDGHYLPPPQQPSSFNQPHYGEPSNAFPWVGPHNQGSYQSLQMGHVAPLDISFAQAGPSTAGYGQQPAFPSSAGFAPQTPVFYPGPTADPRANFAQPESAEQSAQDRGARMDQRWTSFVKDNGLLGEIGFL
ncbi:hypothetical protein OE88DRAFT_1704162 [Heliocybe sulcata]|uniref:Zn(2)-C6 fungal-type domain-containing protein n=1 Tax=Heliocybe sulcata TaxID=5364 RepID=A0A5C3MSD0_9AGAM|nr:hypothetical protein OE88DRAFT_1704162 [Heliocybe sulcata]